MLVREKTKISFEIVFDRPFRVQLNSKTKIRSTWSLSSTELNKIKTRSKILRRIYSTNELSLIEINKFVSHWIETLFSTVAFEQLPGRVEDVPLIPVLAARR